MRIGIVEDHREILNYLTFILESAQHIVFPHLSGASLMDRLFVEREEGAELPYDLVLLDLWLPGGLSGLEVLEYIRQVLPAEDLPVLVISSASGNQLAQLSRRFPGIYVLRKPFRVKDLLQHIEAAQKKFPHSL